MNRFTAEAKRPDPVADRPGETVVLACRSGKTVRRRMTPFEARELAAELLRAAEAGDKLGRRMVGLPEAPAGRANSVEVPE